MKTDEPIDFEILLQRLSDDPELRARVCAEPAGVLAEQGVDLPPGIEVRVVENTDAVRHIVVPQDPNAGLPDAALDAVAGGSGSGRTTIEHAAVASMMSFHHALNRLGMLS